MLCTRDGPKNDDGRFPPPVSERHTGATVDVASWGGLRCVVVSTVSLDRHPTAHYVIVCVRKFQKTTRKRVDNAQHCGYDFFNGAKNRPRG